MSQESYWSGYATNYSREVEQAYANVRAAEQALLAALKLAYPHGAFVRVTHHRGGSRCQFHGWVAGWDPFGSRVVVRNDVTGKSCKWWAAHVELVEGTCHDA